MLGRIFRFKLFWKMLLSYMIALILLLTFMVTSYLFAYNFLENYIVSSLTATMKKSVELIDTRISEINNYFVAYQNNVALKNTLSIMLPLEDPDYALINSANNNLFKVNPENTFIQNYFLYLYEIDTILSLPVSTAGLRETYGQSFGYTGYDYEEWKSFIQALPGGDTSYLPKNEYITNNKPNDGMMMVKKIMSEDYLSDRAAWIVFMDHQKILELFEPVVLQEGGWLYIKNEQGEMVTEKNLSATETVYFDNEVKDDFFETMLNGRNYMVMNRHSSLNGWTYTACIPSSNVYESLGLLKKLFFIGSIVILLLELGYIFLTAKKNALPLMDILALIQSGESKDKQHQNEYDFIKGSVVKLVASNASLRDKMSEQKLYLKASFMERLLRSDFDTEREILNNIQYLDLPLKGGWYTVIFIIINGYTNHIDEIENIESAKLIVINAMESFLKNYVVYNSSNHTIAAVLSGEHAHDLDNMMGVVNKLVDAMHVLNIKLVCGFSYPFQSLSFTGKHLAQAKLAAEKAGKQQLSVLTFCEDQKEDMRLGFTLESQTAMMKIVKAGDMDGLHAFLKEVYEENFVKHSLPVSRIERLLFNLKSSVFLIFDGLKADSTIMEHFSLDQTDQEYGTQFQTCCEALERLCEYAAERNNAALTNLMEDVRAFISEHYGDANLSLYSIAEKFGFTEKYLSKIYKDITNDNITADIEKVRMEKALELLHAGELSIQEVSERVGYLNTNTFYKAFKRNYGVSPRRFSKG